MDKIKFIFTVDIDWASDDVINEGLNIFNINEIPITIFSTHNTSALSCYKDIQIHPNFCNESSHGNSIDEVISFCKNLKSNFKGFRSHRYSTSNDIVEELIKLGCKYSSNVCTNLSYIPPFKTRDNMIEFPVFCEDGGFLLQNKIIDFSKIKDKLPLSGYVVFNFHPMHLAFNSNDFNFMRNLKDSISRSDYQNIKFSTINDKKSRGYGIYSLLSDLINYAKNNEIECLTMSEAYDEINKISSL